LLVVILATFVSAPRAMQRVDEYRLKAAVLYNLAKFVEWPDEAFADATAPLVVCVLGVDPFGAALDDTLRGHSVGGHAASAKRIAEVTPGCHVLFVANSEAKRLPAILERLRTSSVLVIGDAVGFVDRGGMIGLVTDDERVRFDVNLRAAERARIKISARLMALASSVRRSEGTR
jgi:YfiR/HmsC-like